VGHACGGSTDYAVTEFDGAYVREAAAEGK
jgi:hypothetical protein